MTQAKNVALGVSNINASGVLQPAGGGTGLASFTANGAVYSTSTSVLTTGVLPVAAGGTGTSTGYFVAGTKLLFQQTAAPTGWTKSTANDNAALRVVSGTVSTGGSVNFTTAFASQSVAGTIGATTLTTAQIPAHGHTFSGTTGGINANHTHQTYDWGNNAGGLFILNDPPAYYYNAAYFTSGTVSSDHAHGYSGTTANAGSGGSHDHTFTGTAINLAVKYVDTIIATKD